MLAEGAEEIGRLTGGRAGVEHVEEKGKLADETKLRGAEVREAVAADDRDLASDKERKQPGADSHLLSRH